MICACNFRLCITQIRMPHYGSDEGLFAMFDGGRNNEAPLLLQEKVPTILRDEMNHPKTSQQYMKYTLLTAHRYAHVLYTLLTAHRYALYALLTAHRCVLYTLLPAQSYV